MERFFFVVMLCALALSGVKAQETFDEYKRRKDAEYSNYVTNKNKEYEDFRKRINQEYAAMVEKSWQEFKAMQPIPKPKDEPPIPPIVFPEEDKDKTLEDNPKPIEEVVPIDEPEPQPEPVVPIEDTPTPSADKWFTFIYCNTSMKVRLEDKNKFHLTSSEEKQVAQAWNKLSSSAYNSLINDCLTLRSTHQLCDWAYLCMLHDLSQAYYGRACNEATLLTAFLFCQSGYKMRLASTDDGILIMLFASHHKIYNVGYFELDGIYYYPFDNNSSQMRICSASFPKEKPLSLQINREQSLATRQSELRTLVSYRYPDMKVTVRTNENLMLFYDTYPSSEIGENFCSRWALYANAPLSNQARTMLYPTLQRAIQNKTKLEAVNRLLNFVQTAFVYEYDDKVWGCDRAFFADETLYYPYCDCEDRSILFSRLVRDLVGLDVVLIYYPGHLATAVAFPEGVKGDYIVLGNTRYIICDPTYIGAPVGATMPKMNNSQAKAILLE